MSGKLICCMTLGEYLRSSFASTVAESFNPTSLYLGESCMTQTEFGHSNEDQGTVTERELVWSAIASVLWVFASYVGACLLLPAL